MISTIVNEPLMLSIVTRRLTPGVNGKFDQYIMMPRVVDSIEEAQSICHDLIQRVCLIKGEWVGGQITEKSGESLLTIRYDGSLSLNATEKGPDLPALAVWFDAKKLQLRVLSPMYNLSVVMPLESLEIGKLGFELPILIQQSAEKMKSYWMEIIQPSKGQFLARLFPMELNEHLILRKKASILLEETPLLFVAPASKKFQPRIYSSFQLNSNLRQAGDRWVSM